MKKIIKMLSIIFVALFVSGLGLLFFLPAPTLLEKMSFSTAVYDKNHHLLRLTLTDDDKYRLFTPLSQISQKVIAATLLQEDQYFYWHFGINPFALLKAGWQTYAVQSRRVGASTITMQLARLRCGMPSKKIFGKMEQIIRAIQIEMHYSKEKILEAYLNLAPYGGNIEGIGAASLIYFNTEPKTLSLPQVLNLSIIPQNPRKRTRNNQEVKIARDNLFSRWIAQYPQDSDKRALFSLPLMMQTNHQLPFYAPHFVEMVLAHSPSTIKRIETSLDLSLQQTLEWIMHHYLGRKKTFGVNNGALLLVDARDRSIKAFVGSGDFFNQTISGQVNGVESKRSPGSTLKPFIYGLALDQGLIHPNTVLKDVPHSFNGYNPENFDADFMGPIKAKDALVLSRNIPAIYLSSLLNPGLYELLEKAHVSSLKPESTYGLSLNLGAVELTMRELLSLYCMLVNDGIWYPIHWHNNSITQSGSEPGLRLKEHQQWTEEQDSPQRLLSPEASFLILDMLKKTSRENFSKQIKPSSQEVSWKTGTSSGYRDAWTVGSFGPYVLAVWIGNFNNQGNPAFIGKNIAAPLFSEIIDAIAQERGPLPRIETHPNWLNLQKVEVCKSSGMLPTRYCLNREKTWFIPGKSPIKSDTIFREVAINNQTGLRTCHFDDHTRFEVFEFWPSDLLAIFKKAGIKKHTPPPFEPNCSQGSNFAIAPQITSPQMGLDYVLRAGSALDNNIPFSAVTDANSNHLYWFVNEAFVGQSKTGELFLWPAKAGHFIVRAVDEHGLSDARDIHIEMRA